MKVHLIGYETNYLKDVYPDDCAGRDEPIVMHSAVGAIERLDHELTIVNANLDLFETLRQAKPDVVFNLCDDGFFGDSRLEPHVVSMLDVLGIPYTGNGYKALSICLDKPLAKGIVASYGLPTPGYFLAESEEDLSHDLRYPLIVKPSREDGSIGIKPDSVVKNEEELRKIVSRVVKTYKQPALVEEYVAGREFNVALIGNEEPEVLPVSEIQFIGLSKDESIVSYDAKWLKDSKYFKGTVPKCPADIDSDLESELKGIAKRAYEVMDLSGYARIDMRVGDDGPMVIEVNPNPDISDDAGLARSAGAAGIGYDELIGRILDYGLKKGLKDKEGWIGR